MFWFCGEALCSCLSKKVTKEQMFQRCSEGWKQLLRQQVVSQLFICKVVVLHAPLGSGLWSLHLRPQWVHVGRVYTREEQRFYWF